MYITEESLVQSERPEMERERDCPQGGGND